MRAAAMMISSSWRKTFTHQQLALQTTCWFPCFEVWISFQIDETGNVKEKTLEKRVD
jgi:hypothetical protein